MKYFYCSNEILSGWLVRTRKRSKIGWSHISKLLHNIPKTSYAKNLRINTRNKNTWAHHQQRQICGWRSLNSQKMYKASRKSKGVNKNCHWRHQKLIPIKLKRWFSTQNYWKTTLMNREKVEKVNQSVYLRNLLSAGGCDKEIKRRIALPYVVLVGFEGT